MDFMLKYVIFLVVYLTLLGSTREQAEKDFKKSVQRNNRLVNKMNMDNKEHMDGDNVLGTNQLQYKTNQRQLVSSFVSKNVTGLFLDNFENPCWINKERDELQCLPYFFFVDMSGAAKDLYTTLTLHPLVFDPKLKEPGFWYSERFRAGCNSLDYYTSLFGGVTSKLRQCTSSTRAKRTKQCTFKTNISRLDKDFHPAIIGDSSPDTFYFSFAAKSKMIQFYKEELLPQSDNYNPKLLRKIHPGALFVIVIRNPVQRLYDLYNKQFANPSPADFHSKVYSAIEWFINCKKERPYESEWCLFMVAENMSSSMSQFVTEMQKGFYHNTLTRWMKEFEEYQFMVIKYEDYIADREKYIEKTIEFLELKTFGQQDDIIINEPTYEAIPNKQPMWNTTKHLLHALYQPFNDKFSAYLDDNSFKYSDRAGCSIKVELLLTLL